MEKYYIAEYQLMDSQSAILMYTEEIIIYNGENEEEYETLRALEHEDWMQRKADIVCIRSQCSMNGTEIRELQNDGYSPCEPYNDDLGYCYFEKRIAI